MSEPLTDEDAKLVTLARGARGRVSAAEGAAVRDDMGRTYSGATVATATITLSAIQLAIAQAIASGAQGIECAVVISPADDVDIAAVSDLGGAGVPVFVCSSNGALRVKLTT